MTVGSLFAGIGGFDLGFERAGCRVVWQAERDEAAQKVLRRHFPSVRLFDDVKAITSDTAERVDVICGGFPCQDVSVAGKREGLGGARTGLFWEVVRIARALQPRLMVIENVPGLLTSRQGRDFHAVLAALAECGFRREYRILDSRHFGVAQRRRRVFLVLRARDAGDSASQVLFEPTRGGGHLAAGQEAGARVAATLRGRSHGAGVNPPGRGGEDDQNLVAYTLRDNQRNTSQGPANYVHAFDNRDGATDHAAMTLRADCYQANPMIFATVPTLDTSLGHHRGSVGVGDFCVPTLSASMGHHGHSSPRGDGCDPIVAFTLNATHGTQIGQGHNTTYPTTPNGVRRLTPLECERLQGFPAGWTCGCGEGHRGSSFCRCPDSPRYKQLGNAVTVNVAEWIARRLMESDAVQCHRLREAGR